MDGQDVRKVDACRLYANQHLLSGGLWGRRITKLENLRAAEFGNHNRFHAGSLASFRKAALNVRSGLLRHRLARYILSMYFGSFRIYFIHVS